MQETQVSSRGQEDPLEEGMATHFSILAWRIPWTEEPGGLQCRKESDTTEVTYHTSMSSHMERVREWAPKEILKKSIGIGMGNTCKPLAVSFQCMTKSTTNKKK